MKGIKVTCADGFIAVTPAPYIEPLLTPAEVAAVFRVDTKTVGRWARAGRPTSVHPLGGHRRYREAEVRALLHDDGKNVTGPAGHV